MERIFTNASDKKADNASKNSSSRANAPHSSPRKKSARVSLRTLALALAIFAIAAATFLPARRVRAIVIATPPPARPIAAALATPRAISKSLFFTLDDPLSSVTSQRGEVVLAHLTAPLVVDGITLAPAGSPERIKVLNVRAASSGDVYGYVDIFFEPLALANGLRLPLIAPSSRLTVHTTIGHESTVGVEDTVANILFPPHVLYEVFRRGRNIELGKGTQIRAEEGARITIVAGKAFIATPPPLPVLSATPAAAFTPIPLMTPAHPRLPQSRSGPHAPTPTPSPSPSPTATASPTSPA